MYRHEQQEEIEGWQKTHPEMWIAKITEKHGLEFAIDYLQTQDAAYALSRINLTRKPFAGNPALKAQVRAARAALWEMERALSDIMWGRSTDGEA